MYAALLTWFIRRPDDGPIGAETCSLPFIKYDMHDVNCFIILKYMYVNFHLQRVNCLPVSQNGKLICFANTVLGSWQVWKCWLNVPQTFLSCNVIFSTVQHTLSHRYFYITEDTLHRTLHWQQSWHWLKQMWANTRTRRTGSMWQEDGGSGHSQPSRYVESLSQNCLTNSDDFLMYVPKGVERWKTGRGCTHGLG
jgi:hypothetical protein